MGGRTKGGEEMAWLDELIRGGPDKQETYCYCPVCKKDMVSQQKAFLGHDLDGLVVYQCECGEVSRWMFDAPCPLLISDHEKATC